MSITVKDIARMAGVSHTTVLKALNNKPKVGAETRERILKIAQEHNYTVNVNASNLALKNNNVIGLVITDSAIPLLSQMIKVIERSANVQGYKTIVSCTNGDPVKEMEAIQQLHQLRVAGIIIAPTYKSTEFVDYLEKANVPYLVLGRMSGFDIDHITFNDYLAAYQATSYLISCGHKTIACALGTKVLDENTYPYRYWIDGYRTALEEANIPFDPSMLLTCESTQEAGYDLGKEFSALVPEATALISFVGQNIAGLIRGFYERGIRIPEDVSLVCLQDDASLAYYVPSITATVYPNEELGRMAAEHLLQKIADGGTNLPIQRKLLGTKLVIRESVKSI